MELKVDKEELKLVTDLIRDIVLRIEKQNNIIQASVSERGRSLENIKPNPPTPKTNPPEKIIECRICEAEKERVDKDVLVCGDCLEDVKKEYDKEGFIKWAKLSKGGKYSRIRTYQAERKKRFKPVYDPDKDPIKTGV